MMDAVKFLEELKRMCAAYQGCEGCPLHMPDDRWRCKLSLSPVSWKTPSEGIYNAVEKWSAEHPVKRILMDFLEKHPNAPLNNGAPLSPPWFAGYCKAPSCIECELATSGSPACWDLPLEE